MNCLLNLWRQLCDRLHVAAAPDIRFVAKHVRADITFPVQATRTVKAEWLRSQYANPPVKLAHCPGMWDYLQAGYIISAWCDIHIKANKQGVSVRMEGVNTIDAIKAVPMNFALVDGMAPIKDSVKRVVLKIPVPYSIMAKRGISAQILPAVMHSPFLDKLFVYPGEVVYDKFDTVNFIFSPLEECEFTIRAGTPLLQIIPFRRHNFTAECGAPTERENAVANYRFASHIAGFYRRMFHSTKKYSMVVRTDK